MSNLGGLASERGMADGITLAGAAAAHAIAAGLGNGVETTGAELDRLPPGPNDAQRYDSGAVSAFAQATLGAAETLTLAFSVEHSDVGGGVGFAAVPAEDQPANVVLTSAAGGTETGVLKSAIRFSRLKRFVRLKVTATLSAAGADVGTYGAGFVAGGAAVVPTP